MLGKSNCSELSLWLEKLLNLLNGAELHIRQVSNPEKVFHLIFEFLILRNQKLDDLARR